MYAYDNHVIPYRHSFKIIQLTKADENKAMMFAWEVAKKKKGERHHAVDGEKQVKRFTTGIMGEMAVERLLKVPFVDWEIGHSNTFNVSDLKGIGLNVGIKTVETQKFPLVHRNSYRPEIIVIRGTKNRMIICGLASVSVLNRYQDDALILDPRMRARGTKSGFYGFSELQAFTSLEELTSLLRTLDNQSYRTSIASKGGNYL